LRTEDIKVRFKLVDYFRQMGHKVAISLPDLVAQTNGFSVKNRPGCDPALLKSNPKELFLAYNVTCHLEDSDPNGHDVKVHFDLSQVTDASTAKNLDVAVSCSCPAFLYWGGQWNSYQRDALEGEPRPLLTAPTERLDLRDQFVICKHIKAVSERILPSVQHNVVKIIRQRKVEEEKAKGVYQNPALQRRQEEMKKRQEQRRQKEQDLRNKKKKKAPTDDVRTQLEQEPPDDVVQRDTPATPEEKQRVPVLPKQDTTPLPVDTTPDTPPEETPVPSTEDLEDEGRPAQLPLKSKPPKGLTPQRIPTMNKNDRAQMTRLLQDEKKRQMREEQKRRNRETQQRLRNNPGGR
jgi:hypothetical protein